MVKKDSYKNKIVIVTGGTKGIGKGIALAYLRQKAKVIVLARTKPKYLFSSNGNKVIFFQCNVRDPLQTEKVIKEIIKSYKKINILINNVGGAPLVKSLQASINFNNSIIDLNLNSVLNVSYFVAKYMMKSKNSCCVLNLSSVTATRPTPGSAAYGAAKGGLINLTQALAIEWAPQIRVNSLIIGYIETENSLQHYGTKKELKAVAKTIPMQRMGSPDDIANACMFLSSHDASWITGACLEVHGGGEVPSYLSAAKPK